MMYLKLIIIITAYRHGTVRSPACFNSDSTDYKKHRMRTVYMRNFLRHFFTFDLLLLVGFHTTKLIIMTKFYIIMDSREKPFKTKATERCRGLAVEKAITEK